MNAKTLLKSLLLSAIVIAPVVGAVEFRDPLLNQLVKPSAEQTPFVIAQDRNVTLDEAVNLVRRKVGGKVIRSETVSRDGNKTHMIRVLTKDGRMRTCQVDARTGRLRC